MQRWIYLDQKIWMRLLELKDKIEVGDKSWTAVSSIEQKRDWIKEDNFD